MNNKTFWYGTGVLGVTDCLGVGYQMYEFSPWFMPYVAYKFSGPDLAHKMQEQFSGADAANTNLVTSEMIRNGTSYTLNGAFTYSADVRGYYQVIITADVMNQMQREGKNLSTEAAKYELKERVEDQMEPYMEERGLPSRREHLFSAPSLFRGIMGKLGYKVDRDAIKEELAPNTRFLLEESRWGILNYVLKRSIQEAKELYAIKPDPNFKTAIDMLVRTKTEYNTFLNLLRIPASAAYNFIKGKFKIPDSIAAPIDTNSYVEALKHGKSVRKMLATLSYTGEDIFSPNVKFLNIWEGSDANPEAARIAARIYRLALFSVIDGNPYYLQPSPDQIAKYWQESVKEAELVASSTQDPDIGFNDADKKIMAYELIKGKIARDSRREAIESWQPPKEMFDVTSRQRRRVHAKAMQAVGEKIVGQVVTENDVMNRPEILKIYKEAYRVAASEEVGLYAFDSDKSALVQKVQKLADGEVAATLQSPAVEFYYNRLDDIEKLQVLHAFICRSLFEPLCLADGQQIFGRALDVA